MITRHPVRKPVRWETYDNHCLFDYPLLNDLVDLKGGAAAVVTRSTSDIYAHSLFPPHLKTADVDSPRFQSLGLLLEESDTNQLAASNALDAWTKVNHETPVYDTTILNPFGEYGAWKLQVVDADTLNALAKAGGDVGYTGSVYLKKGSTNKAGIYLLDGGFSPLQGVETTLPDEGWRRLDVTSVSAAALFAIIVGEGLLSPTVAAGDYVYAFLPDMKGLDYLTSPILTDVGPVTRGAESMVLDSDVVLPARNSDFAIAATFEILAAPTTDINLFKFNGETTGRVVNLTTGGVIQAYYSGNNETGATVLVPGTKYRILYTGNSTTYKVYINGVLEFTKAIGGAGAGAQTSIGFNTAGGGSFVVSKVRGYNKYFDTAALAAAEACLG